ncbi:MAG: enterotoxin [Verrucomicrobiae bacterium]|nr:enterotoxin [Verrucomicrobiae bacterium]
MKLLRVGFGWFGLTLMFVAWPRVASAVDFPGPEPQQAKATLEGNRFVMENQVLRCEWTTSNGRFKPVRAVDKLSGTTLPMDDVESFRFLVASTPASEPRLMKASDLRVVGKPRLTALKASPASRRLADRCAGRQIVVELASPDGTIEAQWRAVLRDGANYVRQSLRIGAQREAVELQELTLVEWVAPKAEQAGSVDGSPVVAGNFFLGCEHPMSKNIVMPAGSQTLVRCGYRYNLVVEPGRPLELSGVVGVAPDGQMRRGFLHYLERERPQPYHTFLHYNCGYEVGCRFWQVRRYGTPEEFEKFLGEQEAMWLDRIAVFGRELVEKRGVVLDSFVHDHGWDNTELVWQFHKGFPRGFSNVRAAAEKYRSAVGVWFSPWGGYSGRARRFEAGQQQGFETSKNGLTLAGPRYYARFRAACVEMVRNYGVNYFKFDGFGAGNSKDGAGPFASDVEALLRLHEELRGLKPDVFLNPTTGTWPSPFWMLWADAIWRQESDAGFLGKGSDRQQWLTYRDNATIHSTIQRGPLCPISSLMIHGIMIHKLSFKNPYDPKSVGVSLQPADLIAEIRSYFATGTCMQELHIDPSLMTEPLWDVLAEAAKWSRGNSDVLADTHWIGGDPAKGEIYGWASWSKKKAVLALRNPSDQPAEVSLDVAKAFELPAGAPRRYTLKSPWKEDAAKPAITVTAGQPCQFKLQPFEVLVWDALPAREQ